MQVLSTFAGLVSICLALTLRDNGSGPELSLLQLQPQENQNETFALGTSNSSIGTIDRLISPIPGAFPDLRLTVSLDNSRPFLKGSQVMYSGLETVKTFWASQDAKKIRVPFTLRTHEFPKIAVVITPTSLQEELTPVKVAASLVSGMFTIVSLNRRPYGGIFMRMDSKPSGDPLGTIHIWPSTPEANHVLLSNDTLAIAMTPASLYGGNISTTTGQGVAANSTCTPACPPMTANAARQISEEDWLTVFMMPLGHAFYHFASAPVSELLKAPDRKVSFLTRDRKVKCVLRFYDKAVDPADPLTMADFVTGMLAILSQWALADRWHEGWGEIKLHGEREITLEIFRVDAAVGSADGLAIA